MRRNWKRVRANSLVQALRLCKDYALERRNLSVERIADRMGVTHDSLYKWLASARLPVCLVPTYEHTCGCHFVSDWLAACAGRMAIEVPTGKSAGHADMVEMNSGFAQALQLLTDFYANPAAADAQATATALRLHLERVAYHQHNVAHCLEPELEFGHE
ncbi:hypothetical protein [Serpentinimonas maccroryi]|uniref:hypothetical protein n=1 Tax=Serpentinimonas maccroryi TaxID=1458426 RepID=UPI0020344062|nr:hypothetical protein [Serpentinimonas maccroryi]